MLGTVHFDTKQMCLAEKCGGVRRDTCTPVCGWTPLWIGLLPYDGRHSLFAARVIDVSDNHMGALCAKRERRRSPYAR